MNRTFLIFVGLIVAVAISAFAAQTSKRFFLSKDATAIQEVITDQINSPILTLKELTDTVPAHYPHEFTQKFINKKFHMISVSPNDKKIAFVSGEPDQWLGVIDTDLRIYKFILFGKNTNFIDALWSPDSRYLAYAFKGPDRRIVVHLVEPPPADQVKPRPMNGWQYQANAEEYLRAIGWKATGKDTTFAFEVLDAKGKGLETINLPLHRQAPAGPLKSQGE